MLKIQIVAKELTDGSEVFNVHFGQFDFPAPSYQDAEDLAYELSHAINDHSNYEDRAVVHGAR